MHFDIRLWRLMAGLRGRIALGFVLGLAIALALSQIMTRSIGQITAAARGLAAGDIEQRIELRTKDELGQMADVFREMIIYLRGMAEVADAMADGDLTRNLHRHAKRQGTRRHLERRS